jgi:RNA recognition motif-containing protein
MTELYVGNLWFSVTAQELRQLLAPYGMVYSVDLYAENERGQPHAYAFVEMEDEAAQTAVASLDETLFCGRMLHVEVSGLEETLEVV